MTDDKHGPAQQPDREALKHALARFECLAEQFEESGDTASWAMCSVDADRMRKALAPQPALEADPYAYIPDIVKNAMLTMWNYICDDSKHHPLDIEHGKGKLLTFQPRHWAQFTGDMVQRNIRDLFAAPSPAPSPATVERCAKELESHMPDKRSKISCSNAAAIVRALLASPAPSGEPVDDEDHMVKISTLISRLQSTFDQFGDTCVYIRRGGLSWGAVALNRRDDDKKHGVFDLQAQHDRDMLQRVEQVERLIASKNEWMERASKAGACASKPDSSTDGTSS